MDEVYTYVVPLPPGVNEAVMKCADGFTVYLSASLDRDGRIRAYRHAMRHIKEGDFDRTDVQEIERRAHE